MGARFQIPPHVMVREVAGESVILDLETEKYFGLDEVGTVILRAIGAGATVESAVEEVLRLFDAEPDVVHADVRRLLEALVQRGLLREVVDTR